MSDSTSKGLSFSDFDAVKLKYGDIYDFMRKEHKKLIKKIRKPDGPLARRVALGEVRIISAYFKDSLIAKLPHISETSHRTPGLKIAYKSGSKNIIEMTTLTSAPNTRTARPKTGKPWKKLQELTSVRIPNKVNLREATKKKGESGKMGVKYIKSQFRIYDERFGKAPRRLTVVVPPYIDVSFEAMDPDELSNIYLEEYSKYICCLHDESPVEFERLKPDLKEWVKNLLSKSLRNGDENIVHTDLLFIELITSEQSLLENFKRKNREWVIKKVKAEVREMKLENIRQETRILGSNYEDPDVEKTTVVQGEANPDININPRSRQYDMQPYKQFI